MIEEEILLRIAVIFKALGDTVRLKIIRSLCDEEKNVTQLIQELGMKQSNISQHLKVLFQSGVVKRRKQGTQTFYLIADPKVIQICRQLSRSMIKELSENAEKMMQIGETKELFS